MKIRDRVIVALMGGLGNQMFQYACGKALAAARGADLRLDHSNFEHITSDPTSPVRHYELDAFGIDSRWTKRDSLCLAASRRLPGILTWNGRFRVVAERDPYTADTVFPSTGNLYLVGYFQSEEYFKSHRRLIREAFSFMPPRPEYKRKIDYVTSLEQSVAVIVRRDDYLRLGEDITLPKEYYFAAIDYVRARVENPNFLVFSIGDTEWAKLTFGREKRIQIIENHDPDLRNFEKMRLISLCKHDIIANSSFAWWGAWLNRNPDKVVVAPRRWLNNEEIDNKIASNRLPKDWITLQHR